MHRRREALRNLPRTLESTFSKTLARIQEHIHVSQAFIILAWIHSVGPLPLEELQHALAIEPHHTKFHKDNLQSSDTILDCCLGLVKLDTTQPYFFNKIHKKVTLVHSTLSVFLDCHPEILQGYFSGIGLICLRYLSFDPKERPRCIFSLMSESWLRLLHIAKHQSPTEQKSVWGYCVLVNSRINCSRARVPKELLPKQAHELASCNVPVQFARQRLPDQSLLHTACMLGLDGLEPFYEHLDILASQLGVDCINSADLFGLTPLGWTLLSANHFDKSGRKPASSSPLDSFEHNIQRAERLMKLPNTKPDQHLWDVVALEAVRMLGETYAGDFEIDYSSKLPFFFFLSNYSILSMAIRRCMALMESHFKFDLGSVLGHDPTSQPAADDQATQRPWAWSLVGLNKDELSTYRGTMERTRRGFSTDTVFPGYEPQEPERDPRYLPPIGSKNLLALFGHGKVVPALVTDGWINSRAADYCKTRQHITTMSTVPLPGTSCQTFLLPHEALLHVGAVADSIAVVHFALTVGQMDLHLRDHNGITALQLALENGCVSTGTFLVEHGGIDLMFWDSTRRLPLHICAQDHLYLFKIASAILCRCTAHINLQDHQGRTALHCAIDTGKTAMVRLLLKHKADVNLRDVNGLTPLHVAILKRDTMLCNVLLERASGAAFSNDNLQDAWHLATEAGAKFIIPLVRVLQVKHPALLDTQSPCSSSAVTQNGKILRLIFAAANTPSFTENDLDFILKLSSTIRTSSSTAIVLRSGGTYINLPDPGKTIRQAMAKGAGSVAACLLRLCLVDLNCLGEDGESALHLAVIYNAPQAVQLLLGLENIDIAMLDPQGYTALQLAVVHRRLEILQMLLDCPSFTIGQVDSSGATLLILVIRHRFSDAIPMLLTQKQIPINHLDNSGRSAFHYAVMQDDIKTAKLLLECPGMIVATPSHDGRTALSFAALSAGEPMISLLLDTREFQVSHKDSYGKTACDWARMNGCAGVVEALRTANSMH